MGKQYFIVDDVTGKPIEEGQVETIRFSVGDTQYEMDLAKDTAEKFHKAIGVYTEKATKVEPEPQRRVTKPTPAGVKRDPEELRRIREWARANGHEPSDRGRISAEIQAAYDAAHTS